MHKAVPYLAKKCVIVVSVGYSNLLPIGSICKRILVSDFFCVVFR